MKDIYVYAKTTLRSNSGKAYLYGINFKVDATTGMVRFVDEKAKLSIRPYMLIHLMDRVYSECNIALPSGLPNAKWVANPARHGAPHPALEVAGKRYRLDHEVGGSWISNPAVRSLVEYVHYLPSRYEDDEEPVAYLCYCARLWPYTIMDPDNSPKWEIVYQEV